MPPVDFQEPGPIISLSLLRERLSIGGAAVKASVRRFEPGAEFGFREGCHITELSNSAEDPDVSIALARVEPGVTTAWHSLAGTAERYVIVRGRGRVEIGDLAPRDVNSLDVVLIPPGCRQRISNVGDGDLVFLAVCSPRFVTSVYQDMKD